MSYAITESANESNLPMAKEIAEILTIAYPGHSWHVRIDGGILIIKNMNISETASMVRKMADIQHDAGARKHEVIMAAGEFLECAGMRRRAYDEGQKAKHLEGMAKGEKFKPVRGATN
jgi:hypothetical protein